MRVLHYGSPQKKMFMLQEIFYYFIFLDNIWSTPYDYGDSILHWVQWMIFILQDLLKSYASILIIVGLMRK